jgi:import inner membrane translocase subunit TIM23
MSHFWRRDDSAAPQAAPPPSAPPSPPAFDASVSGKALEAESDAFRPPSDMLGAAAGGSGRLYSPYAGLAGTFDPTISRALLELPDAPEFVFSEEAAIHRRTWSENLTYVTGVAYVAGALAGGAYGVSRGVSAPLPPSAEATKLRLNRVLNSGGKSGRTMGNATGVAGLIFSSLDSLTSHFRGEHDSLNTILAGAGTGALYKAPSGPRAAAVWGAGGALLGGLGALGSYAVDKLSSS